MDSLYVCHFSNGHIKVGRSVDPQSRIASHADRVACMGVELAEHFIAECTGPAEPREVVLIRQCVAEGARRFQNEWFTGLDFQTVCEWASAAATAEHQEQDRRDRFGTRVRAARLAAGLTQTEVGDAVGVGKAAISNWESERNGPNVSQLRALCELLCVSADALIFGQVPQPTQRGVMRAHPATSL